MADVNAAFVEQVLNIPKRERKLDVQHHGQADDLGARFEIAEGAMIFHAENLFRHPARFNQVSSDNTLHTSL